MNSKKQSNNILERKITINLNYINNRIDKEFCDNTINN